MSGGATEPENRPVHAYLLKRGEFTPGDNRRCDACGRHCPNGARGAVRFGFIYVEFCRRCWRAAGETLGEVTDFGPRIRTEARADALDEAGKIADELAEWWKSSRPTPATRRDRAVAEAEVLAYRTCGERLRGQARIVRGATDAVRKEMGQ